MALEAARDLAGNTNVKLRDISIGHALIVDQDVEVVFSAPSAFSTEWSQFRIYSVTGDNGVWTQRCEGFLAVEKLELSVPDLDISSDMTEVNVPSLYHSLEPPDYSMVQVSPSYVKLNLPRTRLQVR